MAKPIAVGVICLLVLFGSSLPLLHAARDQPEPSFHLHLPTPTDRDCGEFETRRDAQGFLESRYRREGDSHRLDRDGDGRACEGFAGGAPEQSRERAAD